MTLSEATRRRAVTGGAALAGAVAILLLVATRDRTAPLDWTSPAPYAFLLAAAALGAGLHGAERGPASWRRPLTVGNLGLAGALGGALDVAARRMAASMADLSDTGIPAILLHGGPIIAPLMAARLVPAPGALSLGLLLGHAFAWLLGSPPTSYPALALVQLPLVVAGAELWLATLGRRRAPRDIAAAGALVGLGSTVAALLLVADAGTGMEWLGRLMQDILGGAVMGMLVARLPVPDRLRLRAVQRVRDEDLHAHG